MNRNLLQQCERINFLSLKIFCQVAKNGNLSQAASQCHLTVSAASRRLSELEKLLGTKLLSRTPQGMVLTDAGQRALQHSLQLSQGLDWLVNDMQGLVNGLQGTVRLWANMSSLHERLPEALAAFAGQYPDVHIQLEEQLSSDTLQAVESGHVDLGVVVGDPVQTDLVQTPLYSDRLVLVCAQNHTLKSRHNAFFEDVLSHDFVGLNQGSALLDLGLRQAKALGRNWRLRVQVRSFDALCNMVNSGMGIGLVPLNACQGSIHAHGLHTLSLNDEWAVRRFWMVSRALPELSPSTKILRQFLLNEMRDPSPLKD